MSQTSQNDLILNKSICDKDVDVDEIMSILPPWKTHILEAKLIDKENTPKLRLQFLLDIHNKEDFQKWLISLQDLNKTTYSIHCTPNTTGKFANFIQRLHCHHMTRSKNTYNPSVRSRKTTRNTNCPSKIKVALHAIKKRYRGKDPVKYNLMREMPCEVTFIATHNHDTLSADALRFRKMSEDVKEKLLNLFHGGHSAGTALDALKVEIQLNYDNHEEILADRKFCPTYHDCYYFYKQEFKKKYGSRKVTSTKKKFSKKNLQKFDNLINRPPPGVLERIQILSNNMVLVPSERVKDLFYNVNMEGLVCGCLEWNTEMGCKHVEWASMVVGSKTCGSTPPSQGFKPFYSKTSKCGLNSNEPSNIGHNDVTQDEHIAKENNGINIFDEAKASATDVLAKINDIFTEFIDRSPVEMATALNSMYERLQKIRNPATFATYCINFGYGINQKNRGANFGVSTAIGRQKNNLLSRKKNNVVGRPKKTIRNVKRTSTGTDFVKTRPSR